MLTLKSLLSFFLILVFVSATSAQNMLEKQNQEKIVQIVESERLAFEVISVFKDLFPLPIFENVANAEKIHLKRTMLLAEKYGLVLSKTEKGVYTDDANNKLFNELVTIGSLSEEAAVRVIGKLEEKSVIDLNIIINKTDDAKLIIHFDYLWRGAKKHLRAAVFQCEYLGLEYVPTLLDKSKFQQIILEPDPNLNRIIGS